MKNNRNAPDQNVVDTMFIKGGKNCDKITELIRHRNLYARYGIQR